MDQHELIEQLISILENQDLNQKQREAVETVIEKFRREGLSNDEIVKIIELLLSILFMLNNK